MKLNFNDIKDANHIDDGEHSAVVKEAKFKIAKTGARMVEVVFKIGSAQLYHSFITAKADGTVNYAGWGQLKNLLVCSESGIEEFEDDSQECLMQMCGLSCNVDIKNELDNYSGMMKPRIKKFKKLGAEAAAADNFTM